jgi:serine/threonine protein kinase/tetratricopeptide (TPR) repeat protein
MTTNPAGDGTLPPVSLDAPQVVENETVDRQQLRPPPPPLGNVDPEPLGSPNTLGEPRREPARIVGPTVRELGALRPITLPPRPLVEPLPVDSSGKKGGPRRARAIEAEADLWAALDSGPPSIPSAANVIEPAPAVHDSRPPSPSGISVGQILADRYDVISVLGEGGMGIVYQCRDTYTGDDVAVKRVIIPEGPLANEYVMWFYKESRALATLDHPSIVRARDFGQLQDGSPYLVMDMATGASLHELSHTKMSFPLIWSIVSQMLGALAHAHARGIIHGDMKPSNVLVEELDGEPPRVKILDFGLAWLKQDRHDERLDGTKPLEFAPHAGAGTPGYMAPEQIQHESHNVCGATDLYSLGCILYRMVSGKAPFSGDSKELLRHHAFDMPAVPKLQLEAPNEVTHFVMRLLAKHPWDRWEFASEARAEWDRWRPSANVNPEVWQFPPLPRRKGQSVPPPPKTPRRESIFRLPPGVAIERAPGLLSIRQSPLVGRQDIRTLLRDTCDEVIEGRGPVHRLVILAGPAGVGKSRIAEWLYEAVHEEGTLVPLRARYRALPGPLDGMMGAVTQYFNFERSDRDTIERTLLARWKIGRNDKAGRTWVAGVAEWLRPLGPISDQPIGPSGIRFTLDTPETRRMVIRYTLRRIARGRPLLLWLDDLHHASDTTIDGLLRLIEEEPDQRIVMVATARTEDYVVDPRITERLEPLHDKIGTEIIEVRPMDNETTCALLRASLHLADDAVEEAARRSRGNPLFALQQLHAWALAGELEHSQGHYRVPPDVLAVQPRTTAELWDSRIAALPAEHRLAAFAAASLGADIRRTVLHALLTALELPADSAMLSLQNAEVLVPRGPGRYSWPHALLLEHLTQRLHQTDDARRILRAASEALTRHPLAGTRRIVRQRVVNLLGAGDPDAASMLLFDFLQNAGGAAREPLTLLADLDLLKGKLQGRTLALKHRWQAEGLRQLSRNDEAAIHAEIARSTFEELGDRENRAHTLRLLGHIAAERGRPKEGLSLVEQARGLFEEQNSVAGLAQCEAVAAEIHFVLGDTPTARSMVESGQSHFASLGQPLGRGQCLLLLGSIEQTEGNLERARRRTIEARNEFERAGHRLGIAQADLAIAQIEYRLCDFHSAERGAFDALGIFDALSTPRYQASCERLLAMVCIDLDELDGATEHAQQAARLFQAISDPGGQVESGLLLAQAALLARNPTEAREFLREARRFETVEPEIRQHQLLTEAWFEVDTHAYDEASARLCSAFALFEEHQRAADHTAQLLARLSRTQLSTKALDTVTHWRRLIAERNRRTHE